MKTPEEQLTKVQQAISDILLNAQEAWYSGQKVRKAEPRSFTHFPNSIATPTPP